MQHKKSLGQHFLHDQNVVDKLIRYINPSKKDEVIEIGPGDGAMTKSIISQVSKVTMIEKDTELISTLEDILINHTNSQLINDDILKYDLNAIKKTSKSYWKSSI